MVFCGPKGFLLYQISVILNVRCTEYPLYRMSTLQECLLYQDVCNTWCQEKFRPYNSVKYKLYLNYLPTNFFILIFANTGRPSAVVDETKYLEASSTTFYPSYQSLQNSTVYTLDPSFHYCVEFHYRTNVTGNTVGSLQVGITTPLGRQIGSGVTIKGHQGDSWHSARFEVVNPKYWQSRMANHYLVSSL